MIVLTAPNGKYLTNGEVYTDGRVYLGIYDSAENWREVDAIPDATPAEADTLTAEEKLAQIEEVYNDV